MEIHFSDHSSQPYVRLVCSQETIYAGGAKEVKPQVYDTSEVCYTFELRWVTCQDCLTMPQLQPLLAKRGQLLDKLARYGWSEDDYLTALDECHQQAIGVVRDLPKEDKTPFARAFLREYGRLCFERLGFDPKA